MANCQSEIVDGLVNGTGTDTWLTVQSGTAITVELSNIKRTKVIVQSSSSQTITCTYTMLTPTTLMNITFYRILSNGITISNEGALTISDTTTFQKDISPGTYIICFSMPAGFISGNFKVTYTGYIGAARLQAVAYHGSYAKSILTVTKPSRACNEPMKFWLVDGELPPGCTLLQNGSIYSAEPLIEMDSLNDNYPTSMSWFYFNPDGNSTSIPREWKFTVGVQLINFPTKVDSKTFVIEVHNNWDVDRDAFMYEADKEFDKITKTEYTVPLEGVPATGCIPCVPYVEPTMKEIRAIGQVAPRAIPAATNISNMIISSPEVASFLERNNLLGAVADTINTTDIPIPQEERSKNDIDSLFLETANTMKVAGFPLGAFMFTGENLVADLEIHI